MNRTVLITGASRGIGAACAELFAQNGYNVVINYNYNEKLALALLDKLRSRGFSVVTLKADVSNRLEVENMFSMTEKRFGSVDVLINNAGISKSQLFTDISDEDWDRTFNVNVKGIFYCIKCVLSQMIRKKSGKIINISSIWGITGASCEVDYSASKAAVIGLTKALAKEVGPSGITVNCIAPGVVQTNMLAGLDDESISALKEETPLGIIGEPFDIAHLALYLASEKANFITGQVISPNGGMVI